jgi:RNA polymerase sigma-70 factor (ECF subfamily)
MAGKEAGGFFRATSERWAGRPERSRDSSLLEAVRQAQNGDAAAFEFIYRLHCRRVYALCLRMVKNASEAEDLTQETFLLLFRKIHTFRGESAFSTWLYRLTANIVLMHLRKNKMPLASLEDTFGGEDERRTPRVELGKRDLRLSGLFDRAALRAAIHQLSKSKRATFLLHDVQGYRHTEIAGMLGCSVGTSKCSVHRARKQLRNALSGRLELSRRTK